MDHDIIILSSALIANRLPIDYLKTSDRPVPLENKSGFFRIITCFLKMDIVLGKKIVDIHGKNYRYSTKNYRYF